MTQESVKTKGGWITIVNLTSFASCGKVNSAQLQIRTDNYRLLSHLKISDVPIVGARC